MFSCVIASATTTEVLSSGMGGSRNGALQLVSLFIAQFVSFLLLF
jgi:hypothetical protein